MCGHESVLEPIGHPNCGGKKTVGFSSIYGWKFELHTFFDNKFWGSTSKSANLYCSRMHGTHTAPPIRGCLICASAHTTCFFFFVFQYTQYSEALAAHKCCNKSCANEISYACVQVLLLSQVKYEGTHLHSRYCISKLPHKYTHALNTWVSLYTSMEIPQKMGIFREVKSTSTYTVSLSVGYKYSQ